MKKILIAFILVLMSCSVFAVNLHDNNKIEKDSKGIIIIQKDNKIDDKIKIYKDEKLNKIGDTYYNKHGGVLREDLTNATVIIKDKFISVRNYNKSSKDFEVSMYVGTDNVKYAIIHHNTSTDYNYISLFGDYLGDVISKDGYLYYDTDKFSSQIATIPSHYSTGEIQESGGDYRSVVLDELEIFVDDYFTRVKKFTLCDIRDCTSSPTILDSPTTGSGTIQLDRGVMNYDIDTEDYDTQLIEINTLIPVNYQTYNKGFYAHNDEIQVQILGDDDVYYYSSFYLNYFFPDEGTIFAQTSLFGDILDDPLYLHYLDENDGFVNKGFSSDLITLDDDENFGFKINEHYTNYDTWGIRLNDDVGGPISGSGKELSRYMTGCQSYSGSDIVVQICSNNYKADMVYIQPQGVDFDGSIEIYACNDEFDECITEKMYEVDILIESPDVAPVLVGAIPDTNIAYYSYTSVNLDNYFTGYTSFDVDIDNTACEISKVKNVGLPSGCTVSGVNYMIYPSGLITMESTNVIDSVPIFIGAINSHGVTTDTFILSVSLDSVVDTTGLTDSTDDIDARQSGVEILTNVNANLEKVTKFSSVTATRALLYASDGTSLLASTAFTGDDALFDYDLDNNTNYYVMLDNSGASYTSRYVLTSSFPFIGTNLNIIGSAIGSPIVENLGGLWAIDSITTSNLASSGGIPPGITELEFDDVILLPTGVATYELNDYFYGYDEIELKYYSEEFLQWYIIELNLSETSIENYFGDLGIKLEVGEDGESVDTIFLTVQGNSLPYDDLVYVTAINEIGATSPQNFNVFVNYSIPEEVTPEYYNTFISVGLEYNDVENINLNDIYNYYEYIILSIGSEERTVYLNGSNDLGNITNEFYNVTIENLGTYIALSMISNESDHSVDITVQACNEFGCDSERTFTLLISEEGEAPSDVPTWFPNPDENEKKYYAIGIMIIFLVGIAFIGANGGDNKGLITFGLIGLFVLFLLFSFIGWLPIWMLILLIIVVIMYVSFIIKGLVTGGN